MGDGSEEPLLLSQVGHVATITINRPEQHNVWTPAMATRMECLARRCAADDTVRVIVLTGAGRTFCGGADVAALKAAQEAGPDALPRRARTDDDFGQRYSYLLGIPKTIICALNGPAIGIGAVLPLFCDIRYAAANCRFAPLFVRRGLVAEHGMAWILPRLIGLPRALEMLLSGRTFDADEIERIGLVNAVLPEAGFREEVARRAQELAASVSPRAAGIVKRQVYKALSQSLAGATHDADDEIPGCVASDDFREGVSHFVERRPPRFTGR